MRARLLVIGVTLLALTGCSDDYDELSLTLEHLEEENIELTEEIEQLSKNNEKLVEELMIRETNMSNIDQEYSEKLLDIHVENEKLKRKVRSLEDELVDTKSWSRVLQNSTGDWKLDDNKSIQFIEDVMNEAITPIHNVIICDTYISQIESIKVKNAMVFKLHECLVHWEKKYNEEIAALINDTIEGDYKERQYAEWFAKGMIEKAISEIEALDNRDLINILIQAKEAGYISRMYEEVVVLEHDRAFLIEKYGAYISDDLLAYLELENQMKRYGTWHSEEASKSQLELINIIRENYINSEYRLLSPEALDTYEDELKYQLENIMYWDSYGFKDFDRGVRV